MSESTTDAGLGNSKPHACILGGGIKVEFPPDLKPYKCQLTLMSKAVTGARKAQNCLLESPTGSGKTMAMLCSLLAWQKNLRQEARDVEHAVKMQALANNAALVDQKENKEESPATDTSNITTRQTAKRNRMQFIEEWPESTPLTAADKTMNSSRSESPDMFADDDMEDFKPPKKKVNKNTPANNDRFLHDLTKNSDEFQTSSTSTNTPTTQKDKKNIPPQEQSSPRIRVPKIYFATRTHKQISQVVKEFSRTPYSDMRMTILSSREHSCIRQLDHPYTNKNEMCHALLDGENDPEERMPLSKAGCLFKRNLDRIGNANASAIEFSMDLESPWDIEDLVQAGKKKRMCPYYASRTLMSQAQIIFCPYNYLVDPSIRKSMGISLKDNVIVFDEAHNIEDSMREAVSLSVEETKLEQAVMECQKLTFSGGGASYNVLRNTFQALLDWMRSLSEKLQQENSISNDRTCTLTGTAYIAHMDNKGIGISAFENYVEAVEAVFEELNQNSQGDEEEEDMERSKSQDVKIYQLNKPSQELKVTATGLLLVWSYLFRKDFKYAEDFSVVLSEKSSRFFAEDESSTGWLRAPKVSAKVHLVLNFWCMNPAVAFADFSEAHSVIVTSGTLSPMSSFQSELGIMFPHHLSTDHVIDPSQAWVASVACGPSGKEINGTYRNAITMEYQDEVGDAILKICEAVPFGVLCFFPSYTTLENIVRRWQYTGKWKKLISCKYVIKEPRRGAEFSEAMHNFDLAVRKAEVLYARGTGIPRGEQTGALFLAVFRGKLSEGIDFKDNHARAVITVSIPFPSMSDLQVKLKKKYNDNNHLRTKQLLPGNQWYEIQAYRAINQALGRCVRHKDDWGAIILLDNRFTAESKATASLSKWATKQMKHFRCWDEMYKTLQHFMKTRSGIDMSDEMETIYVDSDDD